MILGLGIDLVEIGRIARILDKFGGRFLQKILTRTELNLLPPQNAVYVAGRFAAKEAAVKALGTGFALGITPSQIEITNNSVGKPELAFKDEALRRAETLGVKKTHISISHERACAVALVILEG